MGLMLKKFRQRIFGRTLTEEELYGRMMFGEDKVFDVNDLLVAGVCNMNMVRQLEVAS